MSFVLFHLVTLEHLIDVPCGKPDGGGLIIILIFQLGKLRQLWALAVRSQSCSKVTEK